MSVRDLWSAVVLEAIADLATEHYGSVAYGQAVSFFIASGEWAESRQYIADCIGLHPDDLMRAGRVAIAERHLRDGPPPVTKRPAALPVQPPSQPEPRVTNPVPVAAPTPAKRPKLARRTKSAPPKHDRALYIARFLARMKAA